MVSSPRTASDQSLPTALSASESWKTGAGEHFSAVCSFDFTAGGPAELTVRAGQSLRLAPRRLQPRVRGWVLASDGSSAGLLPAAYVKIRGAVPAGGLPTGPGVGAGPSMVPTAAAAAVAGQSASQPAPGPADVGVTAAPTPTAAVVAPVAAGAEQKAGDCSGRAAVEATERTCPAVTTTTAAAEIESDGCRSKAATAPVHAPASTPTAPAPAAAATSPTPAPSLSEASCDRLAVMASQLPSNVKMVEVDPATVSVTSLKAAGRAESAAAAAQK